MKPAASGTRVPLIFTTGDRKYISIRPQENHRIMHFMGGRQYAAYCYGERPAVVRRPPWSIHMGGGTTNYTFIWRMGGENLDYTDMNVLTFCQLK